MKSNPILIVSVCLLALVLTGLLGVAILLTAQPDFFGGNETLGTTTVPAPTTTQPTTEPTTLPTTAPATEPTTEPTTVPTTEPVTEPPTEPPTEPQPESFILSFAGDCTLANVQGKTGSGTFLHTVGDKYDYPFADVLPYFSTDECTFINLECVLSDRGSPANKMFTFRGPPEYINILTEGSVEYAGVVNNHTMDYGKDAYKDTLALLDGAGIYYAEDKDTVLFTTPNGLKIGVYSHNFPYEPTGIKTKIKELRDQGAEIVVMCVHWGEEYYFKPNSTQKNIAHYAIEGGADIVYGHHPHVLQNIEHYKDGVIFYSLGNFSFGGNASPADKDTAILQQEIIRDVDGTVRLGELKIIPCYVSGILSWGNDYQPTPIDPEKDATAYERVLKKLSGTYEKDRLPVSYRDDLNPTETTQPSTETTETPTEPTTPSTEGTETTTQPTTPSTDGADTPTEPTTPSTEPTEPPTEPTEPPTEATQPPTEGSQDPPQQGGENQDPPPSEDPPPQSGGTEEPPAQEENPGDPPAA